jgi:hypothetical protein
VKKLALASGIPLALFGLGMVMAKDAGLLLLADALFIVSITVGLNLEARDLRKVNALMERTRTEEALRRDRYYLHMIEQLTLARRVHGPEEYRQTLESLLEHYDENPDFQRQINYVRKELGTL